jgi:ribose 5-phosphate isomerase A
VFVENTGKQAAARAAMHWVRDGMLLGVGTGSTVNLFIDELARWRGKLQGAVPSSNATADRLRAAGIDLVDLNACGPLEIYVDGADETNSHRQLIKGGGGALTREKVIAGAARRFVCIVDESKVVERLGRFPLPVEVIPMARSFVARELVRNGGQPVWRENYVTDNGNAILDVHGLDIADPLALETALAQIPGVVTVGLFARRPADVVIVGGATGVRQF